MFQVTDFPSHIILSLIDVYEDTMTHDKLIFPSTIMRIIHHSSVSYPVSIHFSFMDALSAASVQWSEAQLQPKQPQTGMATPPASFTSSTSAPSSAGGVTLEGIMV